MDVLGQCEGLFLKMRSDLGISGALEVDMEPGVVQDCFEKGALYKSDDKKAIEEVCREILPSQMRGYIHSRRGGDRNQIGDRSFPWSDAM